MKWLAATLFAALLLLQYRLWLSGDGVREVWRLRSAVTVQQSENARLSERNRQLGAEVHDLKQGYEALEERARSDLGMVAGNETFFQVVPQKSVGGGPTTAPATPAAPAQRTAAAH
ncbi:MAG TPA: cell division protein FtsB [Steroidobacteraceae bacterium]|jgi:cell division protein FtsB